MSAGSAAMSRKAPGRGPLGHAQPRIAPPVPARHELAAFKATAQECGLSLAPWQETAARYLTAMGPDDRPLYREVAILVARQQGKTTLMEPVVIRALRAGKRVMHIAQNRSLPRRMFDVVASALSSEPELFPKRRGKVIWPRYGAGQEEIILANGGSYRIAAASTGAARGWSNDIVIIDELREMETFEVIAAAEPTLLMSQYPQMIYLSNAGSDASIVLNAVRSRAGLDPSLAWLEWSAGPDRKVDELAGWLEANPLIGHQPQVLEALEAIYRRHQLAGTLPEFETEYLCRWVVTMQPGLLEPGIWEGARGELGRPTRAALGLALDPAGTRASAVLAWQEPDASFGMRLVADVTGDPIDLGLFGPELRAMAGGLRASQVVYDPYDEQLARYFLKPRPMNGRDFANACGVFVRAVEGRRLRWSDAEAIGDDLAYTTKRAVGRGAWMAVKAKDDRPITAVLAAIRAIGAVAGSPPGMSRIL